MAKKNYKRILKLKNYSVVLKTIVLPRKNYNYSVVLKTIVLPRKNYSVVLKTIVHYQVGNWE